VGSRDGWSGSGFEYPALVIFRISMMCNFLSSIKLEIKLRTHKMDD
jgi:hypothetical protein